MTQRTEQVWTDYGKVDIEVVECTSCGNDVRADDAKEFTMGDAKGWACSTCRDEGPIRFPGTDVKMGGWKGALTAVVTYPVLVWAFSAAGHDEQRDLAVTSGLGALFWAALAYGTFLGGSLVIDGLRTAVQDATAGGSIMGWVVLGFAGWLCMVMLPFALRSAR